jgi:2-oxoglutarate ferredoxin oxidoreductase subunit beta
VRLFDNPSEVAAYFPRPFGVFYTADRPCYEDMMALQVEEAMTTKGMGDLDKLIRGKETWEIL